MAHDDPCDNYDGAFDQCGERFGANHNDGRAIVCELPPGHSLPHECGSGLNVYMWTPKGVRMPKNAKQRLGATKRNR